MTAWKRPNEPIVFQFVHPGESHDKSIEICKNTYLKLWNTQKKVSSSTTHKRKYLCTEGEYIDRTDGSIKKMLLDFWGEWEPDSIAIPFENKTDEFRFLPEYYHIPFYLPLRESYSSSDVGLNKTICDAKNKQADSIGEYYYQNTDPFVFGDTFVYATICKPYETLNIKPGSIILFGSTKNYNEKSNDIGIRFRIDTVFVIKDVVDIKRGDDGKYIFDKNLHYNTSLRFIDPADGYNHKLFIGATPQNSVDGMYSFIPAHCSDGNIGRARFGTMMIDSDFSKYDLIQDTVQWQGYKSCDGKDNVKEFWNELLNYTYDKNFVPATKIFNPPAFDSIDELSEWINNKIIGG